MYVHSPDVSILQHAISLQPQQTALKWMKSWPLMNWTSQIQSPVNYNFVRDHLELGCDCHVGPCTNKRAWGAARIEALYGENSREERPWNQGERKWGRGGRVGWGKSCLRLAGFHRSGRAFAFGFMRILYISPVNPFLRMIWVDFILLHQQSLIKSISLASYGSES